MMKFAESTGICCLKLFIILLGISRSYCSTNYGAPEPPSDLTVSMNSGRTAMITWKPPSKGNYSSFSLLIQGSSDLSKQSTELIIPGHMTSYRLLDLVPGSTYSLEMSTVFDSMKSSACASQNFTTKPSTPGKFIVKLRNETAILVLWNPPEQMGIFTHYMATITPRDAPASVLYVEKKSQPPQAAFTNLIPGRVYNISVQTVSKDEVSNLRTTLYRTVPSRPSEVSVDNSLITSTSFRMVWSPPKDNSEFDRYQINLSGSTSPKFVKRHECAGECVWDFENLEPGKSYRVSLTTLSGKLSSWPSIKNITLRPLPVRNLRSEIDEETGKIRLSWAPEEGSTQDIYKVQYREVEDTLEGSGQVLLVTDETNVKLETLLPGRNYSISVKAISNKVESNETVLYQIVRPFNSISDNFQLI